MFYTLKQTCGAPCNPRTLTSWLATLWPPQWLNIHRIKLKFQRHQRSPDSSAFALTGKSGGGYQLPVAWGGGAVADLHHKRQGDLSLLPRLSRHKVRGVVISIRLLTAVIDGPHLDSVTAREATSVWWRSSPVTLVTDPWDQSLVHLWFVQLDGNNLSEGMRWGCDRWIWSPFQCSPGIIRGTLSEYWHIGAHVGSPGYLACSGVLRKGYLKDNDCSNKLSVRQIDGMDTFERRIGQCSFIPWAVTEFSSICPPEHPRVTSFLCHVPYGCEEWINSCILNLHLDGALCLSFASEIQWRPDESCRWT